MTIWRLAVISRQAVSGSTSRNGDSAKKTTRLATPADSSWRRHADRAACFPPLDDYQRERNRQEHAVVVRRESDATGRAGDQRVTLAWAVRTCTRPHARHRQVGDDDCQGRRHIVLDVMRVPHVQRGHGEEDRGRDRGAMIGEARRQPVEGGNRGRAGRDAKRAAGRIDAGRIGEVQLLQRADGRDLAAQPHPARYPPTQANST